jgi:hypothetical protein
LFVIPAKAEIQFLMVPCFCRDKSGFPSTRLRAEALLRASTGMTALISKQTDLILPHNGDKY